MKPNWSDKMMTFSNKAGSDRRTEQGNVLFLILIAVALFAALSYAVTQSTRSGGGDAGRETSLINSAQITQYPASIKTAITRMIISLSVDPATLEFNPPADLGSLTQATYGVFNPAGGGATYTEAPSSVMAAGTPGVWRFNSENEIFNIGTDGAPSTSSADIIAFLPGVSQAICERIHSQLGISTTIPTEAGVVLDTAATFTLADNMTSANTGIGAGGAIIGDPTLTVTTLNGQPQGCFQQPASTYIYYHVLVER